MDKGKFNHLEKIQALAEMDATDESLLEFGAVKYRARETLLLCAIAEAAIEYRKGNLPVHALQRLDIAIKALEEADI